MEVMRDVNTLLTGRAEALTVSPESIGWVLRGLGLHTDFVPGGRKGLILTQDVREQIHNLVARYGVRTLRDFCHHPVYHLRGALCGIVDVDES